MNFKKHLFNLNNVKLKLIQLEKLKTQSFNIFVIDNDYMKISKYQLYIK